MMLYREDYYNEDCPEEEKNTIEVNVIKHRNGALGRIPLFFDRSRMKFADIDRNSRQAGF